MISLFVLLLSLFFSSTKKYEPDNFRCPFNHLADERAKWCEHPQIGFSPCTDWLFQIGLANKLQKGDEQDSDNRMFDPPAEEFS